MPQINTTNLTDNYCLNEELARELILYVLNCERFDVEEISLILANDDYINKLKQQFFDEDVLTDTITFNLNDVEEPIEGEMYLSADSIAGNAEDLKISLDRECANVIVHSVLHLLGYEDHKDQLRQKMFEIQEQYINLFDYEGILSVKEQ